MDCNKSSPEGVQTPELLEGDRLEFTIESPFPDEPPQLEGEGKVKSIQDGTVVIDWSYDDTDGREFDQDRIMTVLEYGSLEVRRE